MSKRDIRNFFKPLSSNVQPSRVSEPGSVQESIHSKSGRPGRPESYASGSTTSPTSTVKQATKRPLSEAQPTPQISDRESVPPVASQSSTNSTGTKRVVSNGKPVVLNSDSDTDSDDLLELDMDPIIKAPLPTGTVPRTTRFAPYIELQENGLRKPSEKQKRPKASLREFVQSVVEKDKSERVTAEAKAELEKPIEVTPLPEFEMTEEAVAGQLGDGEDGDKAKRILRAMKRTDGLENNCVFHLFKEEVESSTTQEPTFPIACLPEQGWVAQFEDARGRDQAFCSGFAQLVFQYQKLPVELASWMIDQVCLGQYELLNSKYIQLLETYPQYLQTLLDRTRLDTMFRAMGTNMKCLDLSHPVVPSYDDENAPKKHIPSSLKWTILLIQKAVSSLPVDKRLPSKWSSHALHILFHICLDDSVMSDASTLHLVQDTVELIMRKIPSSGLTSVLSDVVPGLLNRITNPILQHNLVRSLPCESPLTAYFQRHLALSFLFHPTMLQYPLSSPNIPLLIHNRLESSPHFKITRDIDYISLAARISLLDIGIGPGPLTVPYQPPSTLAESESQEPPPLEWNSAEETAFNKEVDELANHIKLLSNGIQEVGGIDDMTRLDAKDCFDRLYHRLEDAVRIGGRKSTNVFKNNNSTQGGSRKLFQKWFGPRLPGSRSVTPTANGNVKTDVNGDGQ